MTKPKRAAYSSVATKGHLININDAKVNNNNNSNKGVFNNNNINNNGKRMALNTNSPLKQKTFIADKAYLEFLAHQLKPHKGRFLRPKSGQDFGLRVYFGETDPYIGIELAKQARILWPKHTGANANYTGGIIDICFANEADAKAAEAEPTIFRSRHIRTTRTRHYSDKSLYIGFDNLPQNIRDIDLKDYLEDGLQSYGTLIEFELQYDPLLPSSTPAKAFGVILPNDNTTENISAIPRKAFIFQNKIKSREFNIYPEKAPPVCSKCEHIGHRDNACPSDIRAYLKAQSEAIEIDDKMDDNDHFNAKIISDAFLGSVNEGPLKGSYVATEWGKISGYNVISPITKAEIKSKKLAKQLEKSVNKPKENNNKEDVNSNNPDEIVIIEELPSNIHNLEKINYYEITRPDDSLRLVKDFELIKAFAENEEINSAFFQFKSEVDLIEEFLFEKSIRKYPELNAMFMNLIKGFPGIKTIKEINQTYYNSAASISTNKSPDVFSSDSASESEDNSDSASEKEVAPKSNKNSDLLKRPTMNYDPIIPEIIPKDYDCSSSSMGDDSSC